MKVIQSATAAAGATSQSAGHTIIPSTGNWVGITFGLTVGILGGLTMIMT